MSIAVGGQFVKLFFSTFGTSRGWVLQREVIGRDEGGREGSDEGGAKKDRASTDMPRDASDGRVSGLVFLAKSFISFASLLSCRAMNPLFLGNKQSYDAVRRQCTVLGNCIKSNRIVPLTCPLFR